MTPICSGPADAACVPGRQTAVTARQRTLTASVAICAALGALSACGSDPATTKNAQRAEADESRYAHTADPVADVLERTA
jgi:hypothetical protein